ncbi:hypothetical protein SNOG_07406 [Parastagonospora nodorum SN15]|uniref:Uncharacterized protein n=1 Tax=Phaeosphaeria nodorum (strain SN15 / ATCC MYA-4574 / FGSC 10173) TaxID=321614 RepID=Q0ULF8_PHANO|nr:hypothetical protein SNOG_07406 [Parastagonospora nodorum SN15]EAT84872.1 hypothetical protein SNOG_07406 [Parastagonospora nodorum SN15]
MARDLNRGKDTWDTERAGIIASKSNGKALYMASGYGTDCLLLHPGRLPS